MLFLSGSTGMKPLAFSTSAKLTVALDTREVSSKDSADWKEFLGAKFEWTVTSDSLYALSGDTNMNSGTTAADTLFALMVAKNQVSISFASKSGTSPVWTVNSSKARFTGSAIITNFDLTADDNASATYSITLKGSSTLSLV
jgi:predicted secreted protein